MSALSRTLVVGLVVVGLTSGGAFWWIKVRSPKASNQTAGSTSAAGTAASATKLDPLQQLKLLGAENAAIRPIMDSSLPEALRFAAGNALAKTTLSAAQLDLLLAYLQTPLSADTAGVQVARALRNDVLNALRESNADMAKVIPSLVALAQDSSQDAGLRDYALQHLGAWLPRLAPAQYDLADNALRGALIEPAETYAGTALIALHDLQNRKVLVQPFAAGGEAKRIATDSSYALASRVSALAIAKELDLKDPPLVALATQWASDLSAPTIARRAAEAFLKKTRN